MLKKHMLWKVLLGVTTVELIMGVRSCVVLYKSREKIQKEKKGEAQGVAQVVECCLTSVRS
jgi:hypothetical protein